MHVHDEKVARHHARQAHFPSLYPPSPPVCFLAGPLPSVAVSALFSVLSLACLPVLPGVPRRSPSVPLRPWHVARHCTMLFLLSAGPPRARGTPLAPSRRWLSTCMSPHLGLPQYSSVLDRVTARKLQATPHLCLLLSLSLSSLACPVLTRGPLSLLSPSHAQVTQQCAGHPVFPVPWSLLPLRARCTANLCLLAPSKPLSRPLCLSPLLGPPYPFLSPRAPPFLLYPHSLCSSAL